MLQNQRLEGNMSEWNPELYLKFKEQRAQPAKDLIARINLKFPERILDIGCGAGNSSKELKERWWRAEVLGLDNSRTMIEKAISDYRDINFILADATESIEHLGRFDIIFSNAAMQWMPNIDKLLPVFWSMLNPGGVIAMQIPNPTDMEIQLSIDKIAGASKWIGFFKNFQNGMYLHEPEYYYEILRKLSDKIDIWETNYHHIMLGHKSIIDWYSSTGMKPYLKRLNQVQQEEFAEEILTEIKTEYKLQSDGTVLFEFRRIFFMAQK